MKAHAWWRLAVVGLVGCSRSEAPVVRPEASAVSSGGAVASAAPARATCRIDFTLTTLDPGKPEVKSEFSVSVEENAPGVIKNSRTVPLSVRPSASGAASGASPGMVPQQDVGVRIKTSFTAQGAQLVLRTDLEMSEVDEAGAVHKVMLRSDGLVQPGTPVMVASSEDPSTHRRYQLTARATRVSGEDAREAPAAKPVQRLDFVLTTTDPGKPATTSASSLTVEEGAPGMASVARNVLLAPRASASAVPGQPPAVARQDVGMRLKGSFSGGTVHGEVEVSDVDAGAVRRMSLRGDVAVAPGSSGVVASSEDPTTHRKLELKVSATRLP